MASYYFSNLNHFVDTFLEEHYDLYLKDDGEDSRLEWVQTILDCERHLRDWFDDWTDETDFIKTSPEFKLAILNSVDWDDVLKTIKTHIAEEYGRDKLGRVADMFPVIPKDEDEEIAVESPTTTTVSSPLEGLTRVVNTNWEDVDLLPVKGISDSAIKVGHIIREVFTKERIDGSTKRLSGIRCLDMFYDSRFEVQILYKVLRVNKVHLSTKMCDVEGNTFGDTIKLVRGGDWNVYDPSVRV